MTALAAGLALAAAVAPADLRYDLKAGDRLVYRQVLEQTTRTAAAESATRTEWRSQVLVVAEGADGLVVGFQRQRQRAELLKQREGGKDRLAQEQAAFAERVAQRPAAFAEAARLLRTGWSRLPWSAVREAGSQLLPYLRELPPLALAPSADGTWRGDDDLGFVYHVTDRKPAEGPDCVEVEGRAPRDLGRVTYVFCTGEGLVRRLELAGEYEGLPGRRVKDRLTLELVERKRGEDPLRWLADPETRHGMLQALLAATQLPAGVTAEALLPLLAAEEPPLARRALAVVHRFSLPPPPAARLEALLASPDPRLRTLAVRAAARLPADASRPLLERAAGDADMFVRAAARAAPRPAADARLSGAAQRLGAGDKTAAGLCEPGWSEAALRAQRFPVHPPGDARHRMLNGPHAGRMFVLHVPEDYRGDEPFPLMIVLGGGPGNGLLTAQSTHPVLDPTGYLVVYPHAYGYWWDEATAAAVRALLDDLLGFLNVDVNRVYLTGFSNGGTGTFLYATRWPDRLAAAAPLMGAGHLFFVQGGQDALLANAVRLPMLFIHGDQDEVIVVRATRETVKALRKRDPAAPVEEVILPGRGHDVTVRTDDGRTLAFFEKHRRHPFPRRVTLEARAPGARAYWVGVAEKEGGVASVDAVIGDDHVIRLTTRNVKRVRLLLRRELLPDGGAAPVRVEINGREAWKGSVSDDCALLQESWRAAGDPFLAHGLELALDVPR